MNFIIAADTDIGLGKNTNQDSLSVKVMNTRQGKMVFAILCDGMGGLERGEIASASVIRAFDNWVRQTLPGICVSQLNDEMIRLQWENVIKEQNILLHQYGRKHNVTLGTTAVILMVTQSRYYLMNVGDSRAYAIGDSLIQLTRDQTLVAREIELGNMTYEQALQDPRRNVLLQCIGASDMVFPEMFFGTPYAGQEFMLCSDGFRHEISGDEIYAELAPDVNLNADEMQRHLRKLIELNKQRKERDNISALLIRTF